MKGSNQEHTSQGSSQADWTLVLCPLQENVYYKGEISVDLTPEQRNGNRLGIHPVFNNDGKVDTPGFVLEIQKIGLDSISAPQKSSIAGFKGVSDQEKKAPSDLKIQIPKPLSEKKICFVCRQRYADYLEHITHTSHKRKLKGNVYTRLIEEMCHSFSDEDQKLFAVGKRKYQTPCPDVESDETSDSSPKKPEKKRFVQTPRNQALPNQTKTTLNTFNNSQLMLPNNYVN